MWVRKTWRTSLLLFCFSLAMASGAQAHKLLVSAVAQPDGSLRVQAFFPDGTPAQEVPVAVIPLDGRPPLSGKTDAQGLAEIAPLTPGPYRVEVGDPLGHRAETRVVVAGAGGQEAGKSTKVTPPAPGTAGATALPPAGEPLPWGNLLAGLGFIFGITAFLLVLKLRGEVKKLASRD